MNAKLTTLRALALAVTLTTAAVVEAQNVSPAVPGQAIIRVQPGASVEEAIANIEQLCSSDQACDGVTFDVIDTELADRRLYLLRYEPECEPECDDFEQFLEGIETHPLNLTSDWVERVYLDHAPEIDTGSMWFLTTGGSEFFDGQYGGVDIGLEPAHESTTGQGIVVAVLDTGIEATHPLLQGSIAPGGFNVLEGEIRTNTADPLGHGTFVAGLIHLAAPDAMLLPVVVLGSDGIGTLWNLTEGIFHAIEEDVDVINLSLGSTYDSEAVGVAVDVAKGLGIVVVAAGGNRHWGEDCIFDKCEEFPAARTNEVDDLDVPAVLGVAAVDDENLKWFEFCHMVPELGCVGSNYHSAYFISAPGASLEMEGGPDDYDPAATIYSAVPGGEYGIWEGTSMSTAFVSGGAALVLSQLSGAPGSEALVDTVKCRLALTADPTDPAFEGLLGAGRLNVGSAVNILLGDVVEPLDGAVGIVDFLALLAAWGPADGPNPCLVDLNGDGVVGIQDMLILLMNWG